MTPNPIPDGADAAWVHVYIYGKDGWHVLDSHLEAPDLVMSWQRVSKIWYKGYYDGMHPGGSFALKVHGTLTRPGPRGTPPEFWLTVQGTLAEPPYYVLPPKAVKPIHDKAEFTAYYLKNPQKGTWSSHLEGGQWQNAGQGASKQFSESVAGWYEVKAEHVSEPYSDTASLCLVQLDQLTKGWFTDVQVVTATSPAYVGKNTSQAFRVVPLPSNASWPAGKPVWQPTGGGEVQTPYPADRGLAYVTFPEPCEKLEQPEWIDVECGNTLQGKVIVVGCKFEDTLAAQYATWVASGHPGSFTFRIKLRPTDLSGYLTLRLSQSWQVRQAWVLADQAGGDVDIEWDGTFPGGAVSWSSPVQASVSWEIRATDGSTLVTVHDQEDLYPQSLDLDIDTNGDGSVTVADEAGELSPGAFLGVNDDDDNHNGTPDKDEPGPVTGEDDLRQLVIWKVVPAGFAGTLTLYFDDSVVAVYRGSDRTGLVPDRQTFTQADLPKTLWVEGKAPGTVTISIGASGGGEAKVTANVVGVEVDGFVYGEDARKIENIHSLDPAYVISHGYLQLRARIQPASLADSLYYQWTKTDGTFDGDTEGAGSTYTQVKWNADAAEDVGTITLAVKTPAKGTTIRSLPIKLRDVRPYVVRVKFVDDTLLGYEEQIVDGGDPEYDSIAGKRWPVCYQKGRDMRIKCDLAGAETDETINDLSAATPVEIFPVAKYGGMSMTFSSPPTIEVGGSRNWAIPDYEILISATSTSGGIWDKVGEFEDFHIEWTFKVKDSMGNSTGAFPGKQKTYHSYSDAEGEKYGLYLIFKGPRNNEPVVMKHLNWVCESAHGKTTESDILEAIHDATADRTPPLKPDSPGVDTDSWTRAVDGWSLLFGTRTYGECRDLARLMTYGAWLMGIPADMGNIYASTDTSCLSPEDNTVNGVHVWLVLDFGDGCPPWAPADWASYEPSWNAFEGTCRAGGFYWAQWPKLRAADPIDILRNLSCQQHWAMTGNDIPPGENPDNFTIYTPPVVLTPIPKP